MPILRYDSPAALAAAYEALPKSRRQNAERHAHSWMGGSMADAVKGCVSGDDKLVSEAQRMLDLFEVDAPTMRPEWRPCVYGAYPIVPDALAGYPDAMRRVVNVGSDVAPIRIYVATSSSAALHHDQLTKRGTALLALAMALSAIRPVELYAVATMQSHDEPTRDDRADSGAALIVTKINSQPLDLATACHMLTSITTDRGITHQIGFEHMGFTGGWAFGIEPRLPDARRKLARALDATERDIVVAGAWLYDETVKQPVEFVRKELRAFQERNRMVDEDGFEIGDAA